MDPVLGASLQITLDPAWLLNLRGFSKRKQVSGLAGPRLSRCRTRCTALTVPRVKAPRTSFDNARVVHMFIPSAGGVTRCPGVRVGCGCTRINMSKWHRRKADHDPGWHKVLP